jgi:putative membrane protein
MAPFHGPRERQEGVVTKRLLIRWAVVAASLVVATVVVPGISIQGNRAWLTVAVMAAILSLVNAFVRPILQFLSCGCIVATLGLFLFVVNAFTLWLSSWVAVNWLGVDFVVDGFWPALFGSVIVSIVSFVLNTLLVDRKR